jgi:hypothetical protein
MRSLDRLVRRWEGAAKRYNYDCNTRQAKPGDAARNQLRITAEMAFERMMDELKAVIAPSAFAAAPGSARWKSNATWPDGETTTDLHDTEEQARAVCRILKRDGMGGLQEVYPTKTWVEPSTATKP